MLISEFGISPCIVIHPVEQEFLLLGICFRARRTGNGQNGDGRRGVRGYGGSEGFRKVEFGRKKDEWGVSRGSGKEISG